MASIATLMVTEMVTVKPEGTVMDAVRLMSLNRIGAVLLVDEGGLQGLFSERDLLQRVVAMGRDPENTGIRSVATASVTTVDVNASIRDVLRVFREGRFRHLPVLDHGKPVGLLSTRDFLSFVVDELEHFVNDARYRRELADGVDPYDHLGGSYGK